MRFGLGREITSAHETLSFYSLAARHLTEPLPSQSSLAMLMSLMLLAGLAGCGSASSDNAPGLESRASVSGQAARGTGQGGKGNETGSASGKGTVSGGDNIGSRDTLSKPADIATSGTDERDKAPIPGIPESIAKDLDSPDVRDRLRALEHWEKKGNKAPLDSVFEALEDEDEAIRAKATAIIEQQWAIERERERLEGTTKNKGGVGPS